MDKLESDTDKKEYIILFYQYHHPVRVQKEGKKKMSNNDDMIKIIVTTKTGVTTEHIINCGWDSIIRGYISDKELKFVKIENTYYFKDSIETINFVV